MSHPSYASDTTDNRGSFLRSLEVIGNKLPNPAILFLLLIFGLAALSAVLASQNVTAIHPLTHKLIPIKINNIFFFIHNHLSFYFITYIYYNLYM